MTIVLYLRQDLEIIKIQKTKWQVKQDFADYYFIIQKSEMLMLYVSNIFEKAGKRSLDPEILH